MTNIFLEKLSNVSALPFIRNKFNHGLSTVKQIVKVFSYDIIPGGVKAKLKKTNRKNLWDCAFFHSFSSLAFTSAGATGFYKVTNHGVNIVPKYVVCLHCLQVTKSHWQHNLNRVLQYKLISTFLLAFARCWPWFF